MKSRFLNRAVVGAFLFAFLIPLQGWSKLDPNGTWRFQYALPQANNLNANYAPSEDSVYFGGDGGIVTHWNGSTWTWMTTPTERNIYTMHGSGPNDIWAAGGAPYNMYVNDRSLVMRYDGSNWTLIPNPRDSFDQEPVLRSIYSFAPNDVWAVSDLGPVVWHWNGSAWTLHALPMQAEGSLLNIHGFPNGELFAVGSHGQIFHYKDSTWTIEQKTDSGSFTTNLLQAVWGTSPDSAYVGGNFGQIYHRQPDGTWIDTGLPTGLGLNIWSAWQRSANEVYLLSSTSIRVWDMVNPPSYHDLGVQFRGQWNGAHGAGDRLFAHGPSGVATEIIPADSGPPALSSLTAAGELTFNYFIRGSASCGPHGILVYGRLHNPQQQQPLYYFDGLSQKAFTAKPDGMGTNGDITALLSGGIDDITMAWNDYMSGAGVHHWNGTEWTQLYGFLGDPAPAYAHALVKTPSGTLYGADNSRVVAWDGTDWTNLVSLDQLDPGATVGISAFWARNDSDMYIGTEDGDIYHFNGVVWASHTTPGSAGQTIRRLIGNDTETLALGVNGLAWRRNGTTWLQFTEVEQRGGDNFLDACVANNTIHAVQHTNAGYTGGGKGRVWKLEGNALIQDATNVSGELRTIAATASGTVYALDGYDIILTNNIAEPPPQIQSVVLPADTWVPLGASGIEVKAVNPPDAPVVVGSATINRPPEFLEFDHPDANPVSNQWMVYQEKTNLSSALGDVYLRVPASGPGTLYHQTATGWEEVPATYVSSVGKLESNSPVTLSLWSAGRTIIPIDANLWIMY